MTNASELWATAAATPAPERAHDWSRVAERVKREHATIRALVDDVERACRALDEHRPGSLDRFRVAVATLYIAFDEHLAIEEASLLPVLQAFGARGERRAVSLMSEHVEQRRVIRELTRSAAGAGEDAGAIVAGARALVASFRADMDAEDLSLEGSSPPPSRVAHEEEG